LVRPFTVALVAVPAAVTVVTAVVAVPTYARTVYVLIVDPPLEAGAAQLTVAAALPAVTALITGAPGTVTAAGITALEGAEAGPVPTAFVAETMKVYDVPLINSVTVVVVAVPGAVTVCTGVVAVPASACTV
jgi:hypothetical protein